MDLPAAPIRVYLIAASHLVEEALEWLLGAQPGIVFAGSSRSFEGALQELAGAPSGTPAVDVVLIDPGEREAGVGEALALTRELAAARPGLRLLPLGLAGEEQVVRFLEAGAAGYALRSDSADRVLAAIAGAARGRAACAPRVAALVFARLAELSRRRPSDLPASGALSRRETEVLALLARGLRNKEIARRLGIALSTAGNHVQKIFRKLGVHRRRDVARYALERGLCDGSLPVLGLRAGA